MHSCCFFFLNIWTDMKMLATIKHYLELAQKKSSQENRIYNVTFWLWKINSFLNAICTFYVSVIIFCTKCNGNNHFLFYFFFNPNEFAYSILNISQNSNIVVIKDKPVSSKRVICWPRFIKIVCSELSPSLPWV